MTDRTGILKNSPLVIMLAAIRFASWPLMAKKIDEIHDELRELTPLIQTIQIQNIPVHTSIAGMQGETVTSLWVLLSIDRKLGIHLGPDQLVVFSKGYSTYNDFERVLDKCLSVLMKHMRFIDVTNTGVRYVDHITVKEGEDRKQYITDRLLPATFAGFNDVGCVYVGTYKSGDDNVVMRCCSQSDALAIPEDMIGILSMSQAPGFPLTLETLKSGILLDIDANSVYSTPMRMNHQEVLIKLKELHQKANKFFRHEDVCTDYAFKTWKGEV